MRRMVSFLLILAFCLSLACPAFAAEENFVPSIAYKPEPEIVPVIDEEGNEALGVILDAEGEIIDYVEPECLDVTPIAHVWDKREDVPPEVEELLLFVYDGLNDDSIEISYDMFDAALNSDDMVIRDLFDARWYCEEHPEMVEPEGVTFEITFDLGIGPDIEIYVATYDEQTGMWEPVVKTVNNGDGTVTCTFEHLCAISFSIPMAAAGMTPSEASNSGVMLWIVILVLAAAALIGLLVVKNRKKITAKN